MALDNHVGHRKSREARGAPPLINPLSADINPSLSAAPHEPAGHHLMDFLKSAVASAISKGPLAAYSIGDHVELDHTIWVLNDAVRREGGQLCSIFTFDIAANKNCLPLAKNASRRLRTLRHPGVIQLIETIETDTHIYVITERLIPLALYLQRSHTTEETIKWGAWNIAKTVKFINDEVLAVHCLLRLSSIFSAENGEWKLAGFELLSSTKDEEDSILNTYSSVFPAYRNGLPPEVGKSGWGVYKSASWSAVDAYGYGSLLTELSGGLLPGSGRVPDLANVPGDMQQICKRLLNVNPKLRPSVSSVLDQGRRHGSFFQTTLINLAENIDSLGLKSEQEREDFLRELKDVAHTFPDHFLKRRLLPELLKSVEFGGGGPKVFAVVLEIGAKLSEEEYDTKLTPVLVRLFSSPDRALRVCLLENLSLMIDHLSQKIVNDKIFPNLITGFTDVAPLVREQTVKSVLIIIPKLSDRTINGDLLKYLAKTSNDSEAGIRTNTTVCLGKIAKYIGSGTRTKVLIAAFTRSLRDPFVPARTSALMALGATAEWFSEEDCANRVLPSICPSLVDKERSVRDQANRALELYLQRVRKYSQTLPDTVQARPPSSSGAINGSARTSTPSTESSWAGWAMSSFTSKFASTEVVGEIEAKANGTTAAVPAVVLQPTILPADATRPAALVRGVSEATRVAQSFVAPEVMDDGLWADMDDNLVEHDTGAEDAWGAPTDDYEAGSTSLPDSRSRSPMIPLTTAKPPATSAKFDDNGEPDFAGWLKAQNQAKRQNAPLPKGIASKSSLSSSSAPIAQRPKPVIAAKPAIPTSTARKTPVAHPASSVKAATTPATKNSKPSQEKEEEAWGDAWD